VREGLGEEVVEEKDREWPRPPLSLHSLKPAALWRSLCNPWARAAEMAAPAAPIQQNLGLPAPAGN
jgi:hypothetical protein